MTTVPPDAEVEERHLEFPARDGYALGATLYQRPDGSQPNEVVAFNAGGGLSIARYRHFLRFVAAEGFPVLAYDYRGVGASRPRHLRGFVAGLEDWAEYDQAGAIDAVRKRFPHARIASISHSIGCIVACAAPNASELSQMVFIGPHTGYWRDYATRWRGPMTLFWHAFMPALSRGIGYFPGRWLGVADDFPLRFALQWAGRRTPQFELDDDASVRSRERALLDLAKELRVPGLALRVSDDAFATESGVRRFLCVIPRAPVVRTDLEAAATRGHRIGHFGFFSRRHAELWATVTRFLHLAFEPKSRLSPQD